MTTKKIVLAGVMAALVTVGTMLIQIPTGISGYVHLGDSIIYFAGIALGPVLGGLAAGIGSMFADIFSGYAAYAIPTLIVKGIDGLIIGFLYTKLAKDDFSVNRKLVVYIFSFIVGSIFMVSGYFIFETIMYGIEGSIIGIIPNMFQGIVGGAISIPLFLVYIKRNLASVLHIKS